MAGGKPPGSLEVRAAIKRGRIPPVWLWTGPETYLKHEVWERLVEAVVEGPMADLNVDRFLAGRDKLEQVLGAAGQVPMMASRRVVLFENATDLSAKERESLRAYIRSAAPETALVLTTETGPGAREHQDLREAGAEVAVFWTPFENQTRKWIVLRFQDRGITCTPDAADALLRACGGGDGAQVPLGDIGTEIEKVALALQGRTRIEAEDMRVVARKAHEEQLYAVRDRTCARDLAGALRALDGALLFKENPPHRVVANLFYAWQKLTRAREMLDAGLKGTEAMKAVGSFPREWRGIEAGARRFTAAELHAGLALLARTDRLLKSTGRNPRVVVERALCELCAPSAAGSPR